jgi:hypothetical protein
VPLLDLTDRGDRLFLGFLAATAVVVAILGWQAVESQEVKGALTGGFVEPVELRADVGEQVTLKTQYVNESDRTLTLEGAELIEPTPNLRLLESAVEAGPPRGVVVQLEGEKLAPRVSKVIRVRVEVTAPGGSAGFDDLRLHYRAGGRAGQTAG